MERITITEAEKKTSPNSISLICTKAADGSTNLTTVSWWTYLSNHPPMIGFAVSKKSYCFECLTSNKQVVLSIPGKSIAAEAYKCGCFSGRDINKSEIFEIKLIGNDIKFPEHSKLAFKCIVENYVSAGDHMFFICKILDIFYNKSETQIYAWDGYSYLDIL